MPGFFTNKGFQPRRSSGHKLPPGQCETTYFPVLTASPTPRIALPLPAAPDCFVGGPTGLVESVANGLLAAGLPPATIRTERLGPTGG